MSIYEKFLTELKRLSEEQFPNAHQLAKHLEVEPNLITRWLNRERVPKLDKVSEICERLGITLKLPLEDATREVCFVNAKVVNAGEGAPPVVPEDYLAVPLVEEVGAGPGVIPQGELKSWFLVWRHQAALQGKSDFIAVEIAKGSDSMEPTLCPKDIVLVSRADTSIVNGRMYLVLDPDGSGKIKRVSIKHLPDEKDYRLTYYSDNAAEYEPEVFSLKNDFYNDWKRAVVGRVVWAWSDVSRK